MGELLLNEAVESFRQAGGIPSAPKRQSERFGKPHVLEEAVFWIPLFEVFLKSLKSSSLRPPPQEESGKQKRAEIREFPPNEVLPTPGMQRRGSSPILPKEEVGCAILLLPPM